MVDITMSKLNKLMEEAVTNAVSLTAEEALLTKYLDDDLWELVSNGEMPYWENYSQLAAILRGEGPPCTCDESGHQRQTLFHAAQNMTARITLDDEEASHDVCVRARKLRGCPFVTWLPERFQSHRVFGMAPYAKSPLSAGTQEFLINRLPEVVRDIYHGTRRAWLLVGPAGSSKTTYISAVLRDVDSMRLAYAEPKCLPPRRGMAYLDRLSPRFVNPALRGIWRIKVPDWLVTMHRYDTAEWGEKLPEPGDTVEKIQAEMKETGFRPILWLEEFDKFNPTKTRMNYLLRLIDGVYEVGGTIIASANESLVNLTEIFGGANHEAAYRGQPER